MAKKIMLIVCFMVFEIYGISTMGQVKIPPDILTAFKTGNATELSKYFNSTLQIMLLGKEDFYKKNIAETILKDFFTNCRPKEFIIRHQGGTGDALYAIGNLKTEKGNFRVYFLLKKTDSDFFIHQIRIDPDESK
ncbi:MAG TPA: DUF4783 domain-containing protein [Bacteroidales bacterium]|nr:hypothetical protein [Bacteroidales bacterium]HRC88422.1 DUF4783 domain-containing protein [Bacteroidales bacterium]